MKIKTIRITYWITTSLIALLMTYSAYAYLTNETMVTAFKHLGYPDYFRTELAIAKLIGAVLLIAPVTTHFKEWAYAGFTFTFIAAFIAHTAANDPVSARISPIIILVILAVSYLTLHQIQRKHIGAE